jgi:hypothetical protein
MNIKKIFIFILIILFCVHISCKKTAQREKEPNNNFQSANKIEPDMTIEGVLDTPSDHDYFRLDIVSPVVMDIELSSVKGVNHAIGVWKEKNSEQILLKYIDDSRKSSPERMCNMFFDAGTYFIEISHGDRDNPQGNAENYYELRLTSRDLDDEEKEGNDTYENANLIEIGNDVTGYFSPAFNKLNKSMTFPGREEDWYCFTIDLVDETPVLLDAAISGVPDVKSTLYLFDIDRNELASAGAGGAGDGERLEDIGIMKSGKYYIMAASNFESNNNTPYKLQLAVKNYDYSTELEPNNNFEAANLIIKNEISGKIFPQGDIDYYLYKIQAKDALTAERQYLYRIEASSENLNLILKIFDENRKKLFEIDNLKGPGKEVMPDAFLKKNFYIEVSGKSMLDPPSNYKLNISYYPYSEEYEIEPNDTKETATRIKSNKVIGFISKKDDRDFYLLEFKKRVRKRFNITGIKDSELKISVTDPLGFVIKTGTVVGNDSISFFEMIDGRGYLIVESVKENYDEPYTIELGE